MSHDTPSLRDAWNRLQELVQNEYEGCTKIRKLMNDVAGAIAAEIICRGPRSETAEKDPHEVTFENWLSYQPWSEAVTGQRVYFAGTVRAAWYAGMSKSPPSATGLKEVLAEARSSETYRQETAELARTDDKPGATPRTDVAVDIEAGAEWVPAEVSRQLERELETEQREHNVTKQAHYDATQGISAQLSATTRNDVLEEAREILVLMAEITAMDAYQNKALRVVEKIDAALKGSEDIPRGK